MKRLTTWILGATLSAGTIGAPLVSASPATVDVAGGTAQFCAAEFGYDSNAGLGRPRAGAQPAPVGTGSEVGKYAAEVATGTPYMVRDIKVYGGSYPTEITPVGDNIFFSALGPGGRELYKSDGTEAGTKRVKDVKPGGASSNPYGFVAVGSLVYFNADDGTHGRELFVSDGTSAGTHLVKDINLAGSSEPYEMVNVNGTLYFAADGPGGRELYKSNGSSAGTVRVKDIRKGPRGSSPEEIVSIGSTIYFAAHNKATGFRQIFRSDGTAAGTTPLAAPDPYSSARALTRVGNRVYFLGDSTSGCSLMTFLFRTDGTNAGTFMVTDEVYGDNDYGPNVLRESLNGRFLFSEDGRLRKANASETGLVTVKSFSGTEFGGEAAIVAMARVGSKLILAVDVIADDVYGESPVDRQIWVTDGTRSGTKLLTSSGTPVYSGPMFTKIGGALLFATINNTGSDEIWRTDGTTAGTLRVAELDSNHAVDGLAAAGDSAYFTDDDGVHGRELWRLVP